MRKRTIIYSMGYNTRDICRQFYDFKVQFQVEILPNVNGGKKPKNWIEFAWGLIIKLSFNISYITQLLHWLCSCMSKNCTGPACPARHDTLLCTLGHRLCLGHIYVGKARQGTARHVWARLLKIGHGHVASQSDQANLRPMGLA